MNLTRTLLPLSLSLLLTSCPSSDDDNGNSGGGGGGGGGGGPALVAADLPGVLPCPNQAILTDAAMLTTFKTAILMGSFLYRDVPFAGGDPDIYRKKCGLGAFWDPAASTDEIPPSMSFQDPPVLSDFFVFGNAGICSTNYDMTFADGLPVAGVYRKEFKVSHMGVTYHARIRVTVSGAAAGSSFAALTIAVPADLENTVGYEVDGVNTTHANVLIALANALTAPAASTTLDVLDAPGGNVLMTALVEFLCVEAM